MKKGLVLSGGGTKGIYQCGAVSALRELGRWDFDVITGTSVGALNAAMLVQGDFDAMNEMYENLKASQIIRGYLPGDLSLRGIVKQWGRVKETLNKYLKEEGLDISPFLQMVRKYYDRDRFFASPIDFGCITVTATGQKPVYVTKEMMWDHGEEWLAASASAYPAFPVKRIGSVEYVDGGYFDNSPIDFAMRLGAEEILAIEMHLDPIHPLYVGKRYVTIIHPREELFRLLDFDKEKLRKGRTLGYNDTMKAFGVFSGEKYTFRPFELPPAFDRFYRKLMMLEEKIWIASRMLEKETAVTDLLKKCLRRDQLSYEDYFFGFLDVLMSIAEYDTAKVYDYDKVSKTLSERFQALDHAISSNLLRTSDFRSHDGVISEKTFLDFLHADLHGELQSDVLFAADPFEKALADFTVCVIMHRELKEEEEV